MAVRLDKLDHVFFMGIAGTGMSALAQYLAGSGKQVSGSDRFFADDQPNDVRDKLEAEGIHCHPQDGRGITDQVDLVVASTAVEEEVPEMQKARALGIPVIRRSEMLALIAASKKTIAVGGTSGKSTTSALLFDILRKAGLEPGIISGAGLVSLIRQGRIGNALLGRGEWLVIEADESDGSIIQYHPHTGLLLNIDKDHKEIDALLPIFRQFRDNSQHFIVNYAHPLTRPLSQQQNQDFSADPAFPAAYNGSNFVQEGMESRFLINGQPFRVNLPGRHNMENVLGAVAAAGALGVSLPVCAEALAGYQGIYRRHQVIGRKNNTWLVDDYAHNPAKCAASIRACQPLAPRVIAWFQPHGYGPTRFLKQDFIQEIAAALRPQDELWLSEIFYAGGTATKNISAAEIASGITDLGKKAFFVEDRNQLLNVVRPHLQGETVLLLMGARDPSLESFAQSVWENL